MPFSGKPGAAWLAATLAALLPILAVFFAVTDSGDLAQSTLPTAVVSYEPPPFSLDRVNDDVLWMARCIYSETKRPQEQELVAWVVRNRVETRYRGSDTYSGVVLDPYQFSAFNPGSPKRRLYESLTPQSESAGWARALQIAHRVYHAPETERPFPKRTRHFYSERSMVGGSAPTWADGKRPVTPVKYRVDPKRFRFYSGIASSVLL